MNDKTDMNDKTNPLSTVAVDPLVMKGFIILSRNVSATWSGPVYFLQEEQGPRFGECYTREKATIVSRERFEDLMNKRVLPKNAEFVCVA